MQTIRVFANQLLDNVNKLLKPRAALSRHLVSRYDHPNLKVATQQPPKAVFITASTIFTAVPLQIVNQRCPKSIVWWWSSEMNYFIHLISIVVDRFSCTGRKVRLMWFDSKNVQSHHMSAREHINWFAIDVKICILAENARKASPLCGQTQRTIVQCNKI